MELPVAIIILLIVLIVLALAVFLLATIAELVKINRGLAAAIPLVGELVSKTAPVNGVLDAINGTLVTGRDLLEGLALKKAGPDGAGLVESCFPGEGAKFLRRVGASGAVLPIGEDYPRGAAILNSLLGGTAPVPAAGSAPAPAPAASGAKPDPHRRRRRLRAEQVRPKPCLAAGASRCAIRRLRRPRNPLSLGACRPWARGPGNRLPRPRRPLSLGA